MVNEIYLDNASTTSVDKRVFDKIRKVLEEYGNPSSQHKKGRRARELIERSRKKIANFVGALPEEIFFTSGGTESNNWALKGLAKSHPSKRHIITSVIEHPSVLETCRELESEGYEVDYVGVNKEGIVNIEEIRNKVNSKTLVVSIMHVNNEIGTIQPIEEISKICLEKRVYFHTDAVQSLTKVPLDLKKVHIDLLSSSGHKFNAPKGIGFLYVRKGTRISPLVNGGGQEMGLRSGTENFIGIISMAGAIGLKRNTEKMRNARDKLIEGLLRINGVKINGSIESRVCSNVNVSFYGIEGESLMLMLEEHGIFVSTGSACASNKLAESYVLKALGVDDLYIHGSIRISLDENICGKTDYVLEKIKSSVLRLRKLSPFKLNLEEENEKEI